MLKKVIALITIVCMFGMVFMGCSETKKNTDTSQKVEDSIKQKQPDKKEPKQPKEVTIKFMQYTASGSQEETLDEMIKEFEKANPNIKVDVEVVAFNDYYTKLGTTLTAGAGGPDIFEVGYENFVTYASKGVLLNLTELISKDNNFNPNIYKKLAYDAFKYDGKQYGLVQNFSDVVLFYNKDLFDKNNVEYPKPTWTWKEELEAAKKLTDAKNGVWGTYAPIQFWEFYKTIAQNGGSVFSEDNTSVTINSKECVEALKWMLDKARTYKVSPPLNDDTFQQPDADLNAFKSGKIGMLRAGIWNFGRFSDASFEWDIALEPGNTQKSHHFFTDGLVISKNTEKADAAWEFIKFMSSDPFVVNKRIEKGWNLSAISDEKVMENYYKQTPPKSKTVVTEALDSLVLPPVGPIPDKWNDLTTIVGEELDKARLGKIDEQTALNNAKEKIEKLIER